MKRRARNSKTRAFTLLELMLVIGMMAILAGALGMALAQAMEQGREARTRAQIARIHGLLMMKYDSYRTRSIRLPNSYFPATATAQQRALVRLNILREIMRLEMPQCIGDIVGIDISASPNAPVLTARPNRFFMDPTSPYPALSNNYFRRVQSSPNFLANGAIEAECLYLILSNINDGDTSGIDFLLPSEIGDTDGDGMLEILDAWGRPLLFQRWAPGYSSNPQLCFPAGSPLAPPVASSFQTGTEADPFDPMKADSRGTFLLVPLICSAGPDGGLGLVTVNIDSESSDPFFACFPPYVPPGVPFGPLGAPGAAGGVEYWHDNITNHAQLQQ